MGRHVGFRGQPQYWFSHRHMNMRSMHWKDNQDNPTAQIKVLFSIIHRFIEALQSHPFRHAA